MYVEDINTRIIVTIVLVAIIFLKGLFPKLVRSRDSKLSTTVTAILFLLWLVSPNYDLTLGDLGINHDLGGIIIINFYKSFRIISLITSIQTLGILIIDLLGERLGILTMSVIGGLASSTTMTQVFGIQSKKIKGNVDDLTFAAVSVIANGSSLFEKIVIIGAINIDFLPYVFPFLIVHALVGVIAGGAQMENAFRAGDGKKLNAEYFSVLPIILFLVLYFIINLINGFVGVLFEGSGAGSVIATIISFFGGLDIAIIETSKRALTDLDIWVAMNFILFAFIVNIITKIISGYTLGTKLYLRRLTAGLMITLVISLAAQYIWYYLIIV